MTNDAVTFENGKDMRLEDRGLDCTCGRGSCGHRYEGGDRRIRPQSAGAWFCYKPTHCATPIYHKYTFFKAIPAMLVACAGAIVEHGQHREPPDAAHLNCPPGWGPFMAKKKKSTRAQTGATLTDKAYAILRRAIIQGEFEEGAFLSGPDIMKKYRIGRTPFREACNRLHHERILEVVSRRGYLVPEISFRTVREWLEVRELLEGLIAGLAALRATAEQIREFEALGQRSWSARVDEADYLEMVEANTKFHLHLAKMTQNRELMRLAQSILERTERLSYIEVRSSSVRNTEIRALHGPLVRAIRDRDPIAARRAVIADIRNGERALFDRDVKDHDEEIWGASTGTKNRSVLVS